VFTRRLLLIAAAFLPTMSAEARSRCPPGEYWRPTQQGCSSKSDSATVLHRPWLAFQPVRQAAKPQPGIALTEKQVQRLERKYFGR
jgi:hypothetical protein